MTPRTAALSILHEVNTGGGFINDVFLTVFRSAPELKEQDRRFTEYLVRNVIRKRLSLEDVIGASSSVKLRKMKPRILEILLLGTCELLLMDTPDYAAIDEYVRLTKKTGLQGLSGFVNAVLRNIAVNGRKRLDSQQGALKYSMPGDLYQEMTAWYGAEQTEKICAFFQKEQGGVKIRRNRSRAGDRELRSALLSEGAGLYPSPYADDLYTLKNSGDLRKCEAFMHGLFTVQDMSSALSGDAVRDLFEAGHSRFSVLDACASPGGKTLHAADLMEYFMPDAEKKIISCDVNAGKLVRIEENIRRCGFDFVRTRVQDASVTEESFKEYFDLVLLDVPCSGIGVIGSKPEIRYHAGASDRCELSGIQERILETNAGYVKPGGTILYSTCTIAPEENILQVRRFLKRHPEFCLRGFRQNLGAAFKDAEGPDEGYFQILPGVYDSDGFFMARLLKQDR